MQKAKLEKINVIALYAGFKTGEISRRITPLRFQLSSGETHHVARVRRTYTDRVGRSLHVHFVLKTRESRYFDIVYDSDSMRWFMVVELEEELFFND